MKDFKLIKDLGSGSYGEVSLVNLHDRLFALKQVNKKKVLQVDKVSNVHFERDVLQAANNSYFPDFHFTFQVSVVNCGIFPFTSVNNLNIASLAPKLCGNMIIFSWNLK